MVQEMTSPQSDNYILSNKILHILVLNYTFAEQEPLKAYRNLLLHTTVKNRTIH